MRINHFIGGVLLVAGTTIGAGMLALPVISSFVGFFPSVLIFFTCYLVMLATAFFFLDANFAVPGEPNLISMVENILGKWAKGIAWVFYLLLLYSLTAAYIAASVPLFTSTLASITGYTLPSWIAPFALPLLFGGFVYLGTVGVDVVNRFLMLGLGVAYLLLVGVLPEYIHGDLLLHVDWSPTFLVLPVGITSFGYHIIIPSLTTYMHHDRKKLRSILVIGSLLPLLFYILWQLLILGVVPIEGKVSLSKAWSTGVAATTPLTHIVKNRWIAVGTHFFSFFAIVTSFLGVTLSLSDFITDGFKIKKTWEGRLTACGLTFIPPLLFVFSYQRGFMAALEYAGAFVAILLIFLPAMMAWKLKEPRFYSTFWGRALLLVTIVFSLFITVIVLLDQWGVFKPLIAKYTQGH